MFFGNCRWRICGGRWKAYLITFLLTVVGKEVTDLGNAKLSMSFFLVNNFLISAETVTGSPATVETEFTESKCSEEIVDAKVEGKDE